MTLDEYLAQPCDKQGCDRTADHNGYGRETGQHGKWCNADIDWDKPAFAEHSVIQ